VLARILTGAPDRPTEIRGTIPRHVEAVILKSMEKLPADRFESAADLARALGDPSFRHGPEADAAGGAAAGFWRTAALAAGGVALVLAVALGWNLTRAADPPPTTRSVFAMPQGHEIVDQLYQVASFAPDGSALVYVGSGSGGQPELRVKERGSVESRSLAGTAGAQSPEVDPTGAWVAYIAGSELRKVPLAGGPSIVLADSAMGAVGSLAWLDDSTIAYAAIGFSIRQVPEDGGSSEVIWELPEEGGQTLSLTALPGGKLLFVRCKSLCQSAADLTALDPSTGETEVLEPSVLSAWYMDPGYLVLNRPDGSVFGTGFDPGTLELAGEPIPLFENVQIDQGIIPDMEVGRSGQLLARLGGENARERNFFWVDRQGTRTSVDLSFTYYSQTFVSWKLSPDGRYVAFDRTTDGGTDMWVKELDTGPVYRLTFDEATEFRPEWSPDGEYILFVSERGENRDLYRRRANATGPVELVLDRPREISQGVWSPDGEWLLYREGTADGRDIWVVGPGSDSAAPLVADPGYDEKAPAVSPDGRWLAYESGESGQDEIYIRPFPSVEENRWQVSVGGGRHLLWGPDGREIFYVRNDDSVVVATVNPGPPFSIGSRTALFSVEGILNVQEDHSAWDIHPDGDRFLLSVPAATEESGDVYWILIDNWTTELAERLGGGR
jgi:Tol biopolymer transport system component